MTDRELSMGELDGQAAEAADLAADQEQVTWLTEPANTRRVAAIVPVGIAELGTSILASARENRSRSPRRMVRGNKTGDSTA